MDHSKNKGTAKQAKGTWKQLKGRLQEMWGDLKGSDMDRFENKQDRLVGFIQKQTGEKREAVQRKLNTGRIFRVS